MTKLRRREGWNEAQAATAKLRYRHFLCMQYLGTDFPRCVETWLSYLLL